MGVQPNAASGPASQITGAITFNFNLSADPEPPKEIENLKEQIAANPNSAELYYKLGTVYQSNDHDNEAVEAFNQAIQLHSLLC